jgi:hypothetical protein
MSESLKQKIEVMKIGAVLSETQDYRYGVEQACKEVLALLEENIKTIKENADCYCRHCGQVFDNLQKALKHEKSGVDPHHIHCTVDLTRVLALLEGEKK